LQVKQNFVNVHAVMIAVFKSFVKSSGSLDGWLFQAVVCFCAQVTPFSLHGDTCLDSMEEMACQTEGEVVGAKKISSRIFQVVSGVRRSAVMNRQIARFTIKWQEKFNSASRLFDLCCASRPN